MVRSQKFKISSQMIKGMYTERILHYYTYSWNGIIDERDDNSFTKQIKYEKYLKRHFYIIPTSSIYKKFYAWKLPFPRYFER